MPQKPRSECYILAAIKKGPIALPRNPARTIWRPIRCFTRRVKQSRDAHADLRPRAGQSWEGRYPSGNATRFISLEPRLFGPVCWHHPSRALYHDPNHYILRGPPTRSPRNIETSSNCSFCEDALADPGLDVVINKRAYSPYNALTPSHGCLWTFSPTKTSRCPACCHSIKDSQDASFFS